VKQESYIGHGGLALLVLSRGLLGALGVGVGSGSGSLFGMGDGMWECWV